MDEQLPERIGFRHEIIHNAQGIPFNRDTPLRPEDFLNPQTGDVFFHGEFHDRALLRLHGQLSAHARTLPNVTVLTTVKLLLPPPAQVHPAADLIVVKDLREASRPRAVLYLRAAEALPLCVIELTSPYLAHFDLHEKADLYAAAAIPEYFVFDSGLRPNVSATRPVILGYRLAHGRYQPIRPQQNGRIPCAALGVEFAVSALEFHVFLPGAAAPIVSEAGAGESLSAQQAEARFRAQSIASQLKL